MSLTQIAADLRRQAHQTSQPAKRLLTRGLGLSYKHIDGQCTLTAGRQDIYPSTEEAIIIARAFGVPVGTDPEWHNAPINRWHIITWRWIEIDKPTQPALISTQTTYS